MVCWSLCLGVCKFVLITCTCMHIRTHLNRFCRTSSDYNMRVVLSVYLMETYFRPQVNYGFTVSAAMTYNNSTSMTLKGDSDRIGILEVDSSLEPFKEYFKYRVQKFLHQKQLFESYEGGLEEFAKGALYKS